MASRGRPSSEGTAPAELRHSHNGLERAQLSDIQRARMLAAMAEVASERGVGNVTVAHVVARSGVSRRTFYEHFADREECLLASLEAAVEGIARRVAAAYGREERWRDRIRAALCELLAFLDENPSVGELVVVQALGAGPRVLELRQQALRRIVAAVDLGRGESKPGAEPPPLTAEGVVGGILSVVHARMLEERHAPLIGLAGELMSMIVLPYLGTAAARRELARPAPRGQPPANAGLGSLRDLEMRLTYRTMRVLLAIGALGARGSHPSNRQVADAAGIQDQGQVSKLLRRLEDLDMIRNAGEHRVKGEPNAWTLTERGASVRAAISAQTRSS